MSDLSRLIDEDVSARDDEPTTFYGPNGQDVADSMARLRASAAKLQALRANARAGSPLGSLIADDVAGREASLTATLVQSWRADRQRAARVAELALRAGMAADLVERHIDEVDRRLSAARVDTGALLREAPATAKWAADPANAAAAGDDLAGLGRIEWLLRSVPRAVKTGWQRAEVAGIRALQVLNVAPQSLIDRAEAIKRSTYSGTYGDPNIFGRSIVGTVEQLPNMAGFVAGRTGGALVGAGLAGLVGNAGPQAAFPEEGATLPAGALVGQELGGVLAAFALEAGANYDELLEMRDANGQPLDPRIAANAAATSGAVSAVLETVGAVSVLKVLPFGNVVLGRIRSEVQRRTLSRTVGQVAGAIATETATEIGQEISSIVGEEAAKGASGQPFAPMTPEQITERLLSIAQKTIESSWLLPAGGGAVRYATDARASFGGLADEATLRELAEHARESAVRKRSVELFEGAIREQAREGGGRYVLTDAAAFDAHFAGKGVDPRAQAIKLGAAESYDEAKATGGGDLEIPVEKWLSEIASSPEAFSALVLDSRLHVDHMTPRQAGEWLASSEAHAANLDEPQGPQDGAQDPGRPAPDPSLTPEQKAAQDALRAAEEGHAREAAAFAAALGLDSEEHRAAVEAARQEAESELIRRVTDERKREEDLRRADETAIIRDEAAREIDARPVYKAIRFLTGRTEDLSAIPEPLRGLRLDRARLAEMGFADHTKPGGRLTFLASNNGADPDTLAEVFGFGTGEEMVRAIIAADPRGKALNRLTAERVAARLGEPLPMERIEAAAADAVHGEKRAELLDLEIRRLATRANRAPSSASVLREAARRYMARVPVGTIQPHAFARAGQVAERAAFRAAAAGDFAAALREKVRQARYLFLYREARKAQDEANSAVRYMRRMTTDAARERIGKAGGTYLEQVDALAERYDFRPMTGTAVQRRQSLREWVAEQASAGLTPTIDPALLDEARRVSFREVTLDELRSVRDAVKNIEHLSRLKRELMRGRDRRAFEKTIGELLARLDKTHPARGRLKLSKTAQSTLDRLKETGQKLDAAHVPLEELIASLDGDDPNGPWSEVFVHPLRDATAAERELAQDAAKVIVEKIVAMPKDQRKRLAIERHKIASIDQVLTKREIIAVAANCGNESNLRKLMAGYQTTLGDLIPWGEGTLDEVLSHMTRADWEFVQAVWDALEYKLWPRIAKMHREMTGVEPPHVEAMSFSRRLADGSEITLRGGYYPLVYDRRLSEQGRKQSDTDIAESFSSGFVQWITPHSFTKARIENFAAPIRLDPFVLANHVAEVTHDVSFRQPIMNAWRVLHEPTVKAEIIRRLGEPYFDAIAERLKKTANDRVIDSALVASTYGRVLEHFRSAITGSALAFNAAVFFQNFANIGPAIEQAGFRRFFVDGAVQSIKGGRELAEWIKGASSEMRFRYETHEANVSKEFDAIFRPDGTIASVKRFGLAVHGLSDLAVAYPLWYGVYRGTLRDGNGKVTHEAAVRAADAAVVGALGSGQKWNLSAVQDARLLRVLYQFSSWFANAVARSERRIFRQAATDFRQGRYARGSALFFYRQFLNLIIPAVIGSALMGKRPEEDEGFAEWAFRQIALYLCGVLPLVRDAAAAIDSGRDVRLSPVVTILDKQAKAGRAIGDAVTGDGSLEDAIGKGAEAALYALGVPGVTQAKRVQRAIEADSQNPADYVVGANR